MRAPRGVVIVGAGPAGSAAASELRRLGYAGDLTMVNGEAAPPYNRTLVNKGLLQGQLELAAATLPVPDDEATHWLHGTRARALDAVAREVLLDSGQALAYDAVLVTTGASPRPLSAPVDPAVAWRVRTLRTAADAARLRELLLEVGDGARVTVVGAGLLGAETADYLAGAGAEVCLVDPAPRPLAHVVGDTVATWLVERHRERMTTAFGLTVAAVEAAGERPLVRLPGGEAVEADVVVVSCGVVPAVEWLAGAGLHLGDGVRVDGHLRAAEGVYAAGDLALVADLGHRVEHFGHAMAQGAHAARVIAHDLGLAEDPGPWSAVESFATRLHGKAITVAGARGPADRDVVLLGDPAEGAVTVAAVDASDRLTGLVALGTPKHLNRVRPLLATRGSVAEAQHLLADAAPRPVEVEAAR